MVSHRYKGRDSSVVIATRYGLDGPVIESRWGGGDFPYLSRPALGKWKPMLKRPLGRPKNRWEDNILNDMKKLKIKNWTNYIQDRNKWKLYVEKAKMFKE
jgi:hypothetical protein